MGIGAILNQVVNGQEKVLNYASKALSRTKRNYCVTRRELLAVVYFARHFCPYLYGREFPVRTDHASLKWLFRFKEPEGQLVRWLEALSEYKFNITHRDGKNTEMLTDSLVNLAVNVDDMMMMTKMTVLIVMTIEFV